MCDKFPITTIYITKTQDNLVCFYNQRWKKKQEMKNLRLLFIIVIIISKI